MRANARVVAPMVSISAILTGEIFMGQKKSVPLVIVSMFAGIACMPVAGLVSTALGVGLATLSVLLVFVAG